MRIFDLSRRAFNLGVAAAMLSGCGGAQPLTGGSMMTPHTALIQQKAVAPNCVGAACGWAPADFQARYHLPSDRKGKGQIVAVVDAGDNPTVLSDLGTYRQQFGLGNAKINKYNQDGQQSNYPSYTGWEVEIDLDAEMVSATCPKCTIYLVEAKAPDSTDLEKAEVEAVKLGAHIVSNSWLCTGSSCVHQKAFDAKNVTYLAAGSSGGSQVSLPSSFDNVVAVGGTQLAKSGSTYTETVFNGSGGCATGIKKPQWQAVIPDSVCAFRLANDVSAEAGCSPGVSLYDGNDGGWFPVCGTSVGAPLLAGVFALAGNAAKQRGGRTFWQSKHQKHLYNLKGSCGYRQGQYTTCAGWGSPNGIGAF